MNNKIFFIIFMLIMVSCPVYALSFQDVTNFFASIYNSIASFFNVAFSVLVPKPTPTGGGGGGGGSSTLCSSSLSLSISGKDTCTVTATATSNNCINSTYEIKDEGSKCSGTITVSSFTKTCTWTVTSGAYTYGLYIDGEYKLSKSVSCSKTPPLTCSDGTLYGQCSSTKPKYCDNGNLINKCTQCNCPSGQSCNSTTNLCYTPSQKCTDGTNYGQCAPTKPMYCNNGNLINKCTVCGCPNGQSCNATTNNCYTPISTFMYGVCGHPWALTERDFQEMKTLGVKYVRMDFRWSEFEASRDAAYTYSKYDQFVAWSKTYGIEIIAVPLGFPSWISTTDVTVPPLGPAFDDLVTRWGMFISKIVAHYKGSINYFEIWNEPNVPQFWTDPDATHTSDGGNHGPGTAKYVRLLNESYVQAKTVNPNCKIVSAGIGNDIVYLTEMYQNNAQFDLVGIHPYFTHSPTKNYDVDYINPYNNPYSFGKIQNMRDIMVANGDSAKNILITEIGIDDQHCPVHSGTCSISGYYTKDTCETAGGTWTPGWAPEGHTTQEMQADRLTRIFQKTLQEYPYVAGIMWYQLKDTHKPFSSVPVTDSNWGLFRMNGSWDPDYPNVVDYTPRLMYYAYKNVLNGITTCTSCGSWTNGTCGGSCSSGYRQQTRTCTPTGCTPSDGLGLSRCVADTSCGAPAQFQVTVDSSKVIGINNLSLGLQIDGEWKDWLDSSTRKQLTKDANFKLVRVFDFRNTNPRLMPCLSWNESIKDCNNWNWTYIDSLTQAIFGNGAEPLFALGNGPNTKNYIPPSMAIDSVTGLPYPDSWAAYCKEWPKHFKNTGMPVRFYEIINEPWQYFEWANYAKIDNFMAIFNAAAQAMRAENPNVLLGFDGTNRKPVLNYWLNADYDHPHQIGADLGFISFHKYDSGSLGEYSDAAILNRAETFQIETSTDYYGIKDARQTYYNARGKWIPVINSESNLNSVTDPGTDPRIQQMVGTIWTALVLRKDILIGLNYNIYFHFGSSASWEQANKPPGYGFGMTNLDNNKPYYTYYVHKIIGLNLAVGDSIVNSFSSSADIKTLAWNDNGKLNILLIHNSTGTKTVSLNGMTGQFNYQKIDDPTGTSYLNPSIQTGTIDASSVITLNGYTVMLLQKS